MTSEPTYNAEELKARFNPDGSPLRRQQLVMLEMVKELDRICKKYDIPYFLYGGTLLGAFRHNGFIPWDDDLDVAMLRNDYKRLAKVLPDELPEHMALQDNDNDKNYFFFIPKLRDRRSFLAEANFDKVFKERGIFIDIFPLDRILPWAQKLRLQSLAYNFYRSGNGDEAAMRKVRALTWLNRHISFPLLRGISKLSGTKALMCDLGVPFHNVYDLEDIFPLTTHEFEGIQLPVPGNSHHMLQVMFGDYMKLPDDLDNVYHHVEQLEFYEKTDNDKE